MRRSDGFLRGESILLVARHLPAHYRFRFCLNIPNRKEPTPLIAIIITIIDMKRLSISRNPRITSPKIHLIQKLHYYSRINLALM